jgi:GT2 family glycosyltransferase
MISLQNFVHPEQGICTEHDLYYHSTGAVGFSESTGVLTLSPGTTLSFDSYFNLFNLSKWNAACELENLIFEVTGAGQVEIRITHALPERSPEILHCDITTLKVGKPQQIDISHFARHSAQGLIYVEFKTLEHSAQIHNARFATDMTADMQSANLPDLTVSITTFKREQEVRETVVRLESFLADFPFAKQIHVQVIDNGNSANVPASDRVTPMVNHNYGGAGGFARGLLEAQNAGSSHCLFMDDDASFHMENIARAYVFLALAKSPKAAVAGAMINNTYKWAMWENGAWFEGSCHPLFCGTDLRDQDEVIDMEHKSAHANPATLYGGWWFFAFAIDQVKHHPFPFFVRGDDISFSLMNDFEITTLNGVVSFQDDFTEKESPQTLYLDLRNHLVHHLVSDKLNRGALGTARIAIRFTMRSMLRFHYESARAQLLSWSDVMQGPQFFDENIDMSARRSTIKAMTTTEVWQDIPPQSPADRGRISKLPRRLLRFLGILTLNGHLVPFSAPTWDRITLGIGKRGLVPPAFGAARITYLNTARDKQYTVTQSKAQFLAICWQMTKMLVRFVREFDDLKATYRIGYDAQTTREYWQKRLE